MMGTRSRVTLIVALFAAMTPIAFANPGDEPAPAFDPARPAAGEWIGQVSWNDPIVSYAWQIERDGAFTSGRLGRGDVGGGAWSVHGARLTLKYANGFRYEGTLQTEAYVGTAYTANGRAFGQFSMWRSTRRASEPVVE